MRTVTLPARIVLGQELGSFDIVAKACSVGRTVWNCVEKVKMSEKAKEKVGWPTGFEPATTRSTIWGSNQAELRPPTERDTLVSFCRSVKLVVRPGSSVASDPSKLGRYHGAFWGSRCIGCRTRRTSGST